MSSGLHPADMLPDEMWEELVSHLRNPLDKISLVNCHPWLQEGPYAKINEWHLLSVLPIILEHLKAAKRLEEFQSEVLTWRLISTSCRTLIDKFLYSHEDFFCQFVSPEKIIGYQSSLITRGNGYLPLVAGKLLAICGSTGLEENGRFGRGINLPLFDQVMGLICNVKPVLKKLDLEIDLLADQIPTTNRLWNLLGECQSLEEIYLWIDIRPLEEGELNGENGAEIIPSLPKLRSLYFDLGHLYPWNRLPLPVSMTKWPDLSNLFPNLTDLKIHFSLWKASYNRPGLFPRLLSLTLMRLRLDNAEEEWKLFQLFWCLQAPRLTEIHYDCWDANTSVKYFIDRLIKLTLEKENDANGG